MYQLSDWWDNIPHAMREYKHFMCASKQKEPLNASTGFRGQKDDPEQWLSYGDAVYFAGDMHEGDWLLGFVPRPDDPFVIIDIDNKPDSVFSAEDIERRDQLLAWALENTYVEKSISGNGYHVIISGALSADINRGTKRGIEAYSNRGFVVLTGNLVSKSSSIAHVPDICEWLSVIYGREAGEGEVNDYYSLDQEQINNPPQWELDEDQRFLDSVSGWRNEKNIRSWFYAEETGPEGHGGSEGDLKLLQLFVKFSAKRKYPDESAMRMFLRSPRVRKLGRKNGAWMIYCMTTLGKAKAVVANDVQRDVENAQNFAEGVQNLMAGFEAEREKQATTQAANAINRAQGIPVPLVQSVPIPYKHQFHFQKPAEILNEAPLKWALENVFQMRSVNAIYGWSGVGKSFVAIDMMFAFAQGKEWFGHEAEQLQVTYLALEGSEGLRNRLWAYMKGSNCTQLPDNIDIYRGKFNLRSREMVAEFCDQRKQSGAIGGVIFLDTFAKALPGADENSANDMGAAIEAAETLKDELNACVIIVHHSTKPNADTGIAGALRGSGAIQAGIDGVIQVAKRAIVNSESKEFLGYERFMVMDKAKEAEDGNTYLFELATAEIGERTRKSGEIVKVRSCHVIDVARQVNSRIAPGQNTQSMPTYPASAYASGTNKPVRNPPKGGAKSVTENNKNIADSYDWGSIIFAAMDSFTKRTNGTNRGKHGAPPECDPMNKAELMKIVWEISNPDEVTKEIKKAVDNSINYLVKSGKCGRAYNDGVAYFGKVNF